jgi:UDP-N-acetylglucosamine diphosphorylase / glucose-1-phosphate thymidylyltransferase / UDP-N-acetylgalactosamine diphosphorylase / glucosamine-1-phosphate N-acetyltransferase / galactosamine-1-phosphate N-acetyltransferase
MTGPKNFFDASEWTCQDLLDGVDHVWEVLPKIKNYIRETIRPNLKPLFLQGSFLTRTVVLYQGAFLAEGFSLTPGDATKGNFQVRYRGETLPGATVIYGGVTLAGEELYIGEGSVVESGAFIQGPTRIGRQTEIRQGAYIRGACLIGDRCVVGHVTEMKNAVMLDGAKAGHFAYIGDSILGKDCNLGAGTKCANLKMVKTPISVRIGSQVYETGLRKFGVIMGDRTETGCNAVTSPGTLLGPGCLVAPNVTVKGGYYLPKSVIR